MNRRALMQTPREKYRNDAEYNQLVTLLEGFIEQARFTPSELREACILASINYEMRRAGRYLVDAETLRAIDVLERRFIDKRNS